MDATYSVVFGRDIGTLENGRQIIKPDPLFAQRAPFLGACINFTG